MRSTLHIIYVTVARVNAGWRRDRRAPGLVPESAIAGPQDEALLTV